MGSFQSIFRALFYATLFLCVAMIGGASGTFAADTTAPSVPTDFDAYSASTTSIALKWTASTDDTGVSHYRIEYCDSYNCTDYTLLGTTANTTYNHTGLIAASNPPIYRYRIRAEDAVFNVSAYSTTIYSNQRPTVVAFPEAEGGGSYSLGGRGGAVYEVTNLNDSGPGSLRDVIDRAGPRTIVFRVGGTIELQSYLSITRPYLTIAGQTAPGGGVQISGTNMQQSLFRIHTGNVVIRYIRVRKGLSPTPNPGEPDTVGITYSPYSPTRAEYIVLDHVSSSWGHDENLGIWGSTASGNLGVPSNISIQNSIFSEGLRGHSCGLLTGSNDPAVAGDMKNVDVHKNLFAFNSHRNPLFKGNEQRFINNIVFHWHIAASQSSGGAFDFIGNLYKHPDPDGPSRKAEIQVYRRDASVNCDLAGMGSNLEPSIYVAGNKGHWNTNPNDNTNTAIRVRCENSSTIIGTLEAQYRRSSPLPAAGIPITVMPVDSLEGTLLTMVGASRGLDCMGNWIDNRDSVDIRVVNGVISNYNPGWGYDGSLFGIVSEDEVGGFPVLAPGAPCSDTDHDGMPDAWEVAKGLNPNNAADGSVIHSSGYSNVERYLNGESATPDTTPPTSPTNLSASSSSQLSISISWTAATDNVAVSNYIVERCQGSSCTNFAQVGTPTASPFVDSGLTANTFYNYHVKARDATGNESGWSNVVGATTQAPSTPFSRLIEAESMTIVPPMVVGLDAEASGGLYISPETGSNSSNPVAEATASINIPSSGAYFLWGKIKGLSTTSDSLYLGVDTSWDRFFPSAINVYEWVRIETSNGSGMTGFNLTAGNHMIRVGHGEIGSRLDAVWITADGNAIPSNQSVPCNTVTLTNFSDVTYNSYGAPFDPFTGNTPLLNVTCNRADPATVTLTTGVTGDETRIVLNRGYYLANNTWIPYTGVCNGIPDTRSPEWCRGSISATITDTNISTASATTPTYFVGMTCSVQGGSWKCGCRDTTCANFSWQIQGAGQ